MATDPPADAPKTLFERINVALPVALTALATAFAGLSNGELQKAMFWRCAAAQDQSKATSQWSYAGFKRDRSLICQAAAAQLGAAGGANPFVGGSPDASEARKWLAGNGPPCPTQQEVTDERLRTLLAGIRDRWPEAELTRQAKSIPQAVIDAEIDVAERFADLTAGGWDGTLDEARTLAGKAENRAAGQAALFALEARRYKAESNLNQGVGYLFEARVRVSVAQSERHQHKSYNFFYAMLAAQIGATVSALALARQQRSLLWAVAGATGLVALAIGATVFLSDL